MVVYAAVAAASLLSMASAQMVRPDPVPVPLLREQAARLASWVDERTNIVLPRLMREYGVDMWLTVQQEYGEDVGLFSAIAAPTQFTAGRRAAVMFYFDQDGNWSGQQTISSRTDSLWVDLASKLNETRPGTIAINNDPDIVFSAGLKSGHYQLMEERLAGSIGGTFMDRLVSSRQLATAFLAERVPDMESVYDDMMQTAHSIIGQAFSNEVIKTGETTTDDLRWFMRQRLLELDLDTWFHPSVQVTSSRDEGWTDGVIGEGSLLWTDFGTTAWRMNTDTQHMAYVLAPGETQPPEGILNGLKQSNLMQDIVTSNIVVGRTGNEVLSMSRAEMAAQGIDGTVYCHPIGDHGHGAGPSIGLWNDQTGLPHSGELLFRENTWHSIELQATVFVPEWGREVSFRQEEEARIDDQGNLAWVRFRQEEYWIVDPLEAQPAVQ